MIVNMQQLAEVMGVTVKTLAEWQGDGMPGILVVLGGNGWMRG